MVANGNIITQRLKDKTCIKILTPMQPSTTNQCRYVHFTSKKELEDTKGTIKLIIGIQTDIDMAKK